MPRWPIIIASVAMFVGSLFLPGLGFDPVSPGTTWPGWALLLGGWLGIFSCCPAWFANPLYLIGLLVLALDKPAGHLARLCLLAAPVVGASVVIMVIRGVPSDESGIPDHWTHAHLKSGFYLWMTALAIAAVAAWLPAKERASIIAEHGAPPGRGGV